MPKLFQRLLEDALWPQDTKRGHGQSLCGTQIHDPISANSPQSLLGFSSFWKRCIKKYILKMNQSIELICLDVLVVVSDWNQTCSAFMYLPWWENTLGTTGYFVPVPPSLSTFRTSGPLMGMSRWHGAVQTCCATPCSQKELGSLPGTT